MKRSLLLFLFIISSRSLFGQTDNSFLIRQIDSLKGELRNPLPDTIRAETLRRISSNYLHINPDTAIIFGEQAVELFKSKSNFRKQVFATGMLMEAHIKLGNLPRALEQGLNTIAFVESLGVRESGIGPTYDNLGLIYHILSDNRKALHYYKKNISREDVDIGGAAFGYYGMAVVYESINELDSAILYLNESRKIFHKWNNLDNSSDVNRDIAYQYEVYPAWYNLRARVYMKQNQPEAALEDLRNTLKITTDSKESFHTANTFNDISEYYIKLDQPDSVIYYAEKGLKEARKISYIQGISNASEILAEQYELNDPAKALQYFKLATETQNRLYGAGNIQIMRDMIAQKEKEQADIDATETDFRNRLRLNILLGSTFTLIVIAIFLFRNSRQKQKAKLKIENAYDQLKSTQSQLIHSEKMASLGELTAGIAHEIQNPLNFVNNFSEVNKELMEELKVEIQNGNADEVNALASDIIDNETKIAHHGKRAEGIVKSMLQHSRTSSGEKELTDINALADEYLRLAYHGFRAKDKSFNADFKTELDESLPKISVVPQDIGRVLLNLINNAFQAVKDVEKPMVTITTSQKNGKVEVRIKDNGPGIADEIKDKIFQPFFTTKPAGEGTGLGLSLSYDIVTRCHGGTLELQAVDIGTELIVSLPIKKNQQL